MKELPKGGEGEEGIGMTPKQKDIFIAVVIVFFLSVNTVIFFLKDC